LQLLQSRFADKTIVPVVAERGDGIAELKDVLERFLVEEWREASPK
jgi:hypothetical protein